MSPAVRFEDQLAIPADVGDLDRFRLWSWDEEFPAHARIDFLDGTIEVDMSPEELQSHGALKSALHFHVYGRVQAANLGQVFVDRTRLIHPEAGLSCEPDIVFVSLEALRSGRARYKTGSTPERLIEVEGSASLVVEVVSDSSAGKDKHRLPPLYARAGVNELWLADARRELQFQVFELADGQNRATRTQGDFHHSPVLGQWLRLRREPWELAGTWRFYLDEQR